MGCSVAVILYSIAVLTHIAWMGTIGVRCMFGTKLGEDIPAEYVWRDQRPAVGDTLLSIGEFRIHEGIYADYLQAVRGLNGRVGQTIGVTWRDQTSGELLSASAVVQFPPSRTYFWSCFWFLQELLIFGIGARVFWKRPDDDSAQWFFALCIVTVGAYMGGYHWTEIVVEPALIYPFVLFAVFVPVVNLHFYLVFPRRSPILLRHGGWVLGGLYGTATAYLLALWGTMYAARWLSRHEQSLRAATAFEIVRGLGLGYIALAVTAFGACLFCLAASYRNARTRAERNQVQWILLASVIASVLIAYLLAQAWRDPATLGRNNAAWPMFGVSLLYTVAHAFSITRYKLMQVEAIINRSAVYFAFSLTPGLIYSALLLVFGKLIGDQLFATHATSRGAMAAAVAVIVVLILSELARGRYQRVIDRHFFKEKYKFDRAMQKMRLAVGSLVDRVTLGRRLLEAVAEVLRLEWGALYLGETPGRPMHLVASHGPLPDERTLTPDNALVARLHQTATIRLSHTSVHSASSDEATDAMIALGGGGSGRTGSRRAPRRAACARSQEERHAV
jgi:hypothetical protein